MKWFNYILATIFLSFFLPCSLIAANEAGDQNGHEEFNTVDFIFGHVNDSYEWHFFSVGDKHYSVPLPVILYSKHSGWHFFSSAKFHHPGHDFPFYIPAEGANEGKIVEKLENGSEIVPFDLSLTKTVLGSIMVSLILIFVMIKGARKTVANQFKTPKGIQNIVEPLVLFVRDDIAKPFAGPKYQRYVPYLLTLFSFVLLANLFGLILPLGFNITGNIAVTMVLAAITFLITSFSGNKHYWGHIVNPDVPIYMKIPVPLMPLIEFAGIFIKPIVLMIRLFANMLAGHMIITVLIALIFLMSTVLSPVVGAGTSIISIAFSIFMVLLDILVSAIQAYIFTLLSAMYFGMATDNGH
ncbi:F0F1 ATP synthase subunit A [Roseimarinus sediminis]|uniref:F0F1 ATP synthase subunit A n=1 Tax=Roseimarinus sediminis TaxID=1610899 RepID=UPI003D24810B